MQVFDASSIIYAWDNYPIENFPPLWRWMTENIGTGEFSIPQVAYDEVIRKSPDCGQWLKEHGITVLPLTKEIMNDAMDIKHMLGIVEDNYHPKGVDENDIIIIATAKVIGTVLISDEGRQFRLPDNMAKYKIPTVCDLDGINIKCIHFIDLIKGSGEIFG